MAKIKEFMEQYEKIEQDIQKLKLQKISLINNLDLKDIEEFCDYTTTKKIHNTIRFVNEEISVRLSHLLNKKRLEEYPGILGVRYYPEIKNITGLTEDEKVKLDRKIEKAYRRNLERRSLVELDKGILEQLITLKIISREYIFKCNCTCCDEEIIHEERYNKYLKCWENKTHNGFEVRCWNGNDYEVTSKEEFDDNLSEIRYRVIKEPDTTLDDI